MTVALCARPGVPTLAPVLPSILEQADVACEVFVIDARAAGFARSTEDPILVAECLRMARAALDRLTGRAGTEDMFDRLFGAFCIGK